MGHHDGPLFTTPRTGRGVLAQAPAEEEASASQKIPKGSRSTRGMSLFPIAGRNSDDGTGKRGEEPGRRPAGLQYDTNALIWSCSY